MSQTTLMITLIIVAVVAWLPALSAMSAYSAPRWRESLLEGPLISGKMEMLQKR